VHGVRRARGRHGPCLDPQIGAYVLSRRPRYILFIASMWSARPMGLAEVGRNVAAVSERDLWKDRRFWTEYRLRSAPLPAGGHANYFERAAP
jgi:hypothetical protein